MEPAALALLMADQTIPERADLVACGSTVGSLLRFVRGADKPFRFLVEVIHNTVFFVRRENSPTELISGVYGYGHTFPEAYTTWDADVKGSASHQRLIEYSFAELRLFVRSEGNGYIAESAPVIQKSKDISIDGLISDMASEKVTEKIFTGLNLKIQSVGEVVGQDLIFELKTRSIKKKNQEDHDILGEELPRMWVSQVPKFILAYHTSGVFDDIEIKEVRQDIEEWERCQRKAVSRLAALIHRIIGEVRERPDGKLEICYSGSGELQVREQQPGAGDALSAETRALWIKKKDAEKTEESPQVDIAWVEKDDFTACTESCGYCGRCTY
jgi:hypothetical protein